MHFEDKSMVDGQKFQEKKLDTTKQPYELIWYQPISPSWMSSTRDMFGVDQVEVRAWHQVGKELKIETNVGEMKFTVRRTPDYFVEFIRMERPCSSPRPMSPPPPSPPPSIPSSTCQATPCSARCSACTARAASTRDRDT